MMGTTHVACGWVAGLATLSIAPVEGPVRSAAWVVTCAGCALLPDIDKPGSSVARMWGPVSNAVATGVARVAGGHRRGTHDIILSPLVFSGITLLACLTKVGTALVLAFVIGLALKALGLSGVHRYGASTNAIISVVGAWALVSQVDDSLIVLPLVVALGIWVHCLGDFFTNEGLPVPLIWIRWRKKRMAIPAFTTGSAIESSIRMGLHACMLLMMWNFVARFSSLPSLDSIF